MPQQQWTRRRLDAAPGPAHLVKVSAVAAARRAVFPFRYFTTACDRRLRGLVEHAPAPEMLPEGWRACRDCAALTPGEG